MIRPFALPPAQSPRCRACTSAPRRTGSPWELEWTHPAFARSRCTCCARACSSGCRARRTRPASLNRCGASRWRSYEIEQQHLGPFAFFEHDLRGVNGLERVACIERVAVHRDLAARHLHVSTPSGRELAACAFRAVEERRVDVCILVDLDRALTAVGRGDQPQPAPLRCGVKMLLLVSRGDSRDVRLDPDLQEVGDAVPGVVELAVHHAFARAHPLDVPRHDGRAVAHAVLVRERPFEHVADDFYVAVAVGAETRAGLDAVLVDHPTVAEAHVLGIVATGEGKAVIRAQPPMIGVTAVFAFSDFNHGASYWDARPVHQALMIFRLNARSMSQIPATATIAKEPPIKTRRR